MKHTYEATATIKITIEVEHDDRASQMTRDAAHQASEIMTGLEKVSGGKIRVWDFEGASAIKEIN